MDTSSSHTGYQVIPRTSISPDPTQPRKRFAVGPLQELADSIAANGLLEPVIVRPLGDGYILVAGERRWRACGIAGLETMPAIIRDDLTEDRTLVLQIIENVVRADMDPIEEARAYQRLVESGLTVAEISHQLGKAQAEITYRLQLLRLAPAIQDLVAAGQLPVWHGAKLSRLSIEGQYRVIRAQTAGDLRFTKDLDRLVDAIQLQENQSELFADMAPVTPEQARAAKELRRALEAVAAAIVSCTALASKAAPSADLEYEGLLAEEIRKSTGTLAAAVHERRAIQLAMAS